MKERVGIIDIGSNTFRLVIYEQAHTNGSFKEIENIKIYARLRSYFDQDQCLNEEGMKLVTNSLKDFEKILASYHTKNIICAATASIRQAANNDSILRIVKEETKIPLTIFSEYEEAFYGYLAVVHSMNITEGITIDIGGGSTEITYFRDRKLLYYHSFPFGTLSLKLQFIKGNLPTEQEREQIKQYILEQLHTLPWIANQQVPVIAIGGSARNTGSLHQQFSKYPLNDIHQYEMGISDIAMVKERLLPLSISDLQKLEGLSKDRADTILPAIEVFEVLCRHSKATKFIINRKGLRDGILYHNWLSTTEASQVDISINEFIEDTCIQMLDGQQLTKLAVAFFEQICHSTDMGEIFSNEELTLLKRAARIYLLGKGIDAESSLTAFFLISNRTILGITHRERLKLALVASFMGKGTLQKYIQPFKDWYTKEELTKIAVLGAILKLSKCLNSTNQNNVEEIKITPIDDVWHLNIQCKGDYLSEYHFEKQKKHLEKLLKITIIAHFYR